MPFSIIPFLLLAIPLLEIAVFVFVGEHIGVLPTLALVLATAIAGSILLRVQGFSVLTKIRRTVEQGQVPGRELVHGVMILLAGILLLTPGFVTDTLGFLLFIPPVRDAVWRFLRHHLIVVGGAGQPQRSNSKARQNRVIDLDTGDYSPTDDSDTPWRGPDGKRD